MTVGISGRSDGGARPYSRTIPTIIPRRGAASDRMLPLVLAPLIALAVGAAFALIVLFGVAGEWRSAVDGGVSITIPAQDAAQDAIDGLIEDLTLAEGVSTVRRLPTLEVEALIAPWLGSSLPSLEGRLPAVIEVELSEPGLIVTASLRSLTMGLMPQARFEDHAGRLDGLLRVLTGLRVAAALCLIIVVVACLVSVVASTRASLSVHHRIVDTLYTLGADDRFIAKAFEGHVRRLVLRGCLMGLLVAPVGLLLVTLGSGLADRLWPGTMGFVLAITAALLLPLLLVLLSGLSARVTVMRRLADYL